jgi:L-serine/L-threonine ammonia-lyase
MLGIGTTVVVPKTTSPAVIERIRAQCAAVIQHGADYVDARNYALAMAQAESSTYVPPFDHPDLWEGHASLIDESRYQCTFDAVICSVGGGGLLSGVIEGLKRNGIQVPVIAVETTGASSLAASIASGRVVELDSVDSVATSLAARAVCEEALARSLTYDVRSTVVTDEQAIRASLAFAETHRALVEPACGAALHVALSDHPALVRFRAPLVVVCGGVGVDVSTFARWAAERSL